MDHTSITKPKSFIRIVANIKNQLTVICTTHGECKLTIIPSEKVRLESKFYGSCKISTPKIVSEYDQEIPQSQTADNPVALRGRAAKASRDTRKTN